jgi:mannose-6-phosphate isomerase-like protein (cupin superfamily)
MGRERVKTALLSAAFCLLKSVTEPKEVTMLEKHQLKILSDAVSEAWKNINFTKVNGLDVRLRVIKDRAANFHAHANSDELFCCLEGVAHLDTADDRTITLKPQELAVVPRNTSHRLRVEGGAVVLVIDALTG